jgi:hypothetical protein
MLDPVAAAFILLHEAQVMDPDMKPDNILIDTDSEIKR